MTSPSTNTLHCGLCGPDHEGPCPGHPLLESLQRLDARAHAGDGESAADEASAAPPPAWYFTFGCGSPLAHYYVMIDAESEHQARARMIGMFSLSWAGCYTREDFEGSKQAERFNLIPLRINKNASVRLQTNAAPMPDDLYRIAYPW